MLKVSSIFLALGCVALAPVLRVTLATTPGPGYHLIKTVQLGAAPGGGEYFDYITVDSAARRVYLAHGTEIKVINANNFNVVSTITGGLKRTRGVAVVPELGKGFISDGDLAAAVMFDLKALKVTGQVKADKDAD